MHLVGPAFQKHPGQIMVRQKSKRHLSFEQLDARIAMNGDSYPLRLIGFESASRNYAPSIQVRTVILANRSASIELQQIEIQQFASLRFLPKYDFFRFNAHPSHGKMIAEGEGLDRSDKQTQTPPSHSPGNAFAEGEIQGKPPAKVHGAESPILSANPPTPSVTPILTVTQSSVSAAVKQNLQPSASSVGQNQSVSRPELNLSKPLSLQPQSSDLVADSTIRTASASPLSDNLTSKRDYNSVSIAPQVSVLQSKSSLNDHASVSSNAKGLTQTEMVISPRTESAKTTKDGMLSFAMNGSLRAELDRPNGIQSKASRIRTQQQNDVLLRQIQDAQIDSIIDELAVNTKRLPAPKGMIEIRNFVEHSQRQSVVAKASANPFEILQLFIGSSNMVQSRSESEAQSLPAIGNGFDSPKSTELATKEDILVTLGIGAVLAIAIRESRVRLRTNPLIATLGLPVAQAT